MKALREYIRLGGRGTVARIAREMNVSHNTVKRWESGENEPGKYRIAKLRAMLAQKVVVVTVWTKDGCDVTGK